MSGYLPQAILLGLIVFDLCEVFKLRTRMRRVSLTETFVGWVAILLLLIWGGFFR